MNIKTLIKISRLFTLVLIAGYLTSCSSNSDPIVNPAVTDNTVSVVLLHTNDEHGWMEGSEPYYGAAEMLQLWKTNEGFSTAGNFLVLSGGDNWTGPAISTWFNGESMVEVMNAMNYTASAIGNHEFDYKVDILRDRISEANFPYLSANIRMKGTGNVPDFAVPYIIKRISGISFGIIGLTTLSTPRSAFPENVKDYDFIPYQQALNQYVPEMISQGAEFIIVNGHICVNEMRALTSTAKSLGIEILTGGHCNEQYASFNDGVLIIESDAHLKGYSRVEIKYDTLANTTISLSPAFIRNSDNTADASLQNIISKWRNQTDNALSENIGYASAVISQNSAAMFNMIADSWLYSYPNADVSISNKGGVRQSLPAGDITLESIVGILPFDNQIMVLQLTGAELISSLNSSLFTGGMTRSGGYFLSDGSQVSQTESYSVLITDYMYQSNSSFQEYDSNPYTYSVNFRQPLIDWIKSLNTSPANPLNNFLDNVSRE